MTTTSAFLATSTASAISLALTAGSTSLTSSAAQIRFSVIRTASA